MTTTIKVSDARPGGDRRLPGIPGCRDDIRDRIAHHATDRGWPNHIRVEGPSGLDRPSWIMTEQPRTFSPDRLTGTAGEVSSGCLSAVRTWLGDFLDLQSRHETRARHRDPFHGVPCPLKDRRRA